MIAGIGLGTFHPSTYAQFDRLVFPRTGKTFGVFELWGSATLVIMFFVNGTLLGGLDWQGVLRLAGAAGLVISLLYYWKFKNGEVFQPAEQETSAPADGKRGVGPILPLFFIATILRFLSTTAVLNFTPHLPGSGVALPGDLRHTRLALLRHDVGTKEDPVLVTKEELSDGLRILERHVEKAGRGVYQQIGIEV